MDNNFLNDWNFNKEKGPPKVGDLIEFNIRSDTKETGFGHLLKLEGDLAYIGTKGDQGQNMVKTISFSDIVNSCDKLKLIGEY